MTRTIFSLEARTQIGKLLDDEKPDLVHIHNIHHHITPSILGVIKKRGIPIVWTLHDYTIICPNTSFLTGHGLVCEACKGNRFYMAPIKKCKKNSLAASTIAMIENYMHRLMDVYRHVDLFLAPSEFLRRKFVEYGMGQKVVVLNNFVNIDKFEPCYTSEDYYVYIGRLSHVKGLDVLLRAASKNPNIKLKIIGDGELFNLYRHHKPDHIEFLGFKTGDELTSIVSNSMFTVVPSQWYENAPYSVLESMALGKPVIGSDIGGIPELIVNDVNGYLFDYKDVNQLAVKIKDLSGNRELQVLMGKDARRTVEEKFSQYRHYEKLMEIYKNVLEK